MFWNVLGILVGSQSPRACCTLCAEGTAASILMTMTRLAQGWAPARRSVHLSFCRCPPASGARSLDQKTGSPTLPGPFSSSRHEAAPPPSSVLPSVWLLWTGSGPRIASDPAGLFSELPCSSHPLAILRWRWFCGLWLPPRPECPSQIVPTLRPRLCAQNLGCERAPLASGPASPLSPNPWLRVNPSLPGSSQVPGQPCMNDEDLRACA